MKATLKGRWYYKHRTARRYGIPRQRWRVTDWPACEAGLRRRSDLTLWLTRDGTRATDEPMSDRAVPRVVQARVAVAGLDPALFGGHSLRVGFITAATAAGAIAFRMREVSRHTSIQVLTDHVRQTEALEDHPGERVPGSCLTRMQWSHPPCARPSRP